MDGGQQGVGWREDLLVGRIDASCILVYGLIPEANQGTIMRVPLPTAPQLDQIGRAVRRAAQPPRTGAGSGGKRGSQSNRVSVYDPHPWRLARERTGAADHSTAPSRSAQRA
ncbi:hypothetical protein [Streptomyces sp. NBC_00286]|uniref:hypothetical protein n=1 Tax=Streptomyces sp. NBC_00286 TaxID=2975701 RepID=UPI002E2C8511|nr:hypothetical protein [Streptomyces sp. NBC_00286]